MNTKILGVFVCMLMILATTFSVAGNLSNEGIKIVKCKNCKVSRMYLQLMGTTACENQ